jgi:vitamin B12 transporter
MKRVRAAILALGVLLRVACVAAEEHTAQLAEVVVTATRTHTRAEDVTTSFTVVDRQQIEQRGQDFTSDALRSVPGMDIIDFGSPGQTSFASIRGSAPDQVLVLLDGVEVNTPTVGQFDFANLLTDNVDRIEVLRGGGTLYGSNAIGGVVNVMSRRGEGPFRLLASGEAGSAATNHEVLGVNGAHGPFALSGTASFLGSDGFRSINSDYRNLSTDWRADVDLLPGGTARVFLRYTDARAGLVNFNVADGILDPNAYSHSDFFLAKGEWEHVLSNGLVYRAATSYVSNNERARDDSNEPADAGEPVALTHFPSQIIAANAQAEYLWRELALTTLGLEFKESSAQVFSLQTEEEDGLPDTEVERFNANRSNVALFGQEQIRALHDNLDLAGGVRYDHYDQFGDEVTGSASAAYLIQPTRTRLRFSWAQGFRAPTFDELFEPTFGNPNLNPERSWEINGGFTQDFGIAGLRFEPTYFYRNVKNLIEEVSDQLPSPIAGLPNNNGPEARNLNARLQGVELVTRAQPANWLALSANYTYLNAVTPTGVLFNRPRHRGSFVATVTQPDLLKGGDRSSATVLVYAVGDRNSPDPTNEFAPAQIGSYARVDLALQYGFAGRWAPLILTATVRNLFNRDYSESIGFPAPPARFLIGFRYELGLASCL